MPVSPEDRRYYEQAWLGNEEAGWERSQEWNAEEEEEYMLAFVRDFLDQDGRILARACEKFNQLATEGKIEPIAENSEADRHRRDRMIDVLYREACQEFGLELPQVSRD